MSTLPSLKHFVRMAYGDALAQEVREEGDVPVFGSNGIAGTHSSANTASPAIIIGRKGSYGKVTWTEVPSFCIDTAYYVDYRHTSCNLRWLFWALQTLGLDLHSEDTGVPGLSREKAHQTKLRVPSRHEQEQIAKFLDHKTARIDALIAEKARLLEASSNLFTARLGTSVVEGLPGSANLVSAASYGFESVKEGWSLVPLKHLASSVGGLTPSKDNSDFWDGSVPWVSPKDMKSFVIEDSIDHVSEAALEQTSLRLQPVNSVLVVVRGMILAHTFPVALNAVPVTINQDMKALRVTGRVSAHYLAWMLRGLQPLVLSLTDESAHGTKALRTEQWANQCVPVPPVEEQEHLVAQFEAWESEAQTLYEHLTVHIARLREYRTSLISAAVTGQLDVSAFKRTVQ